MDTPDNDSKNRKRRIGFAVLGAVVAGVADQSQRGGWFFEFGDEVLVVQVERGRDRGHHLRRQRPHRVDIGQRGGLEFRQLGRPFVQSVKWIAGDDTRIVGTEIVEDVKTLAEVRLGIHMHFRCANDLRAVRQIADVQIADLQLEFPLQRQIEKPRGRGKGAVDQALVDAVIGDHQKSGVAAGLLHRPGQSRSSTRLTGEIRTNIQQRNAARRIGRSGRGENLAHAQTSDVFGQA